MRLRKLLLVILIGGILAGCTSVEGAGLQVTITPVSLATKPPTLTPQATVTVPQVSTITPTETQAVQNTPVSTSTELPNHEPTNNELPVPTATVIPSTPTVIPSPTTRPTLAPEAWRDLPVIPELSPNALAIIQDGLARGNNPRVFSKIGDCESQTTWFLGDFDMGPKSYALGPYEGELQPVVDYYQGSFNRLSKAAKAGFTSASVMSRLWTDRQTCDKNETPLGCELRLNKPVMAFIMLGTNDASNPKTFEGHMRKIIEYTISQGVLPVLGTKADNMEGDESINATIARLAYEYDIPLWNYWRAVQDLPDQGLQEDRLHLTFGPTRFDDPANLENAWPVRNLNAMQILKLVMDQTQ